MIGSKILITDENLPSYDKEFIILFKVPDTDDLWSFGKDKNQAMASGYAGSIQFKIIK